MTNFVHLHVHSDHSLLDGYSTIDEYINKAVELNQPALALTDHNTMTNIYTFIKKCRKAGIKPLPGVEINMAPINDLGAKVKEPIMYGDRQIIPKRGSAVHLTLLAKNMTGLINLYKLIHISYEPDNYFTVPRIDLNILKEYSEGLIVLSGCPNSEINIRLRLGQKDKAYEYASILKEIFKDDFYIEIMNYKTSVGYSPQDLLKLSKELNIKPVFTNDVHYLKPEDSEMQEKIMALGNGNKMDETPSYKGGFRIALGGNDRYLKSFDEMVALYNYTKMPELITNTLEIADKVEDMNIEYDNHLRPKIDIPKEFDTNLDYLKYLIKEGFKRKRGRADREVQETSKNKIKEELEVIVANDFIDYFLVVWDYCKWSRDNGWPLGTGRGCFLRNSKVTTSNGIKPIKEICSGELVLTKDGSYQKVLEKQAYNVTRENCIRLHLSNDEVIECTHDHRIFKKYSGFIAAERLKVGDILTHTSDNSIEYDRHLKNFSGRYYSERMNDKIHYFNSWELDFIYELEVNSTIKEYYRKDDKIHILDKENNLLKLHAPFVTENYNGEIKLYYVITTEDNYVIEEIQKLADSLNYEIEFITKDSLKTYKEVEVIKIDKFIFTGTVYDLSVENTLNYTVSNVSVHNSVGGSELAYLLDVSRTDPIRFDLMFERFISPGRGATYEIEYEDGSKETINVAEKKLVNDNYKYIHQLKIGDEIEE